MILTWAQLTFLPEDEALHALRRSWAWLVPEDAKPFMFSLSGDVFFESSEGAVHWLDTGQGVLQRIAASREEFLARMYEDGGHEWLMAGLLDDFVARGMQIGTGRCPGYRVLPILGGTYDDHNMVPLPVVEWYGLSGELHAQLADLPDGTPVKFHFVD